MSGGIEIEKVIQTAGGILVPGMPGRLYRPTDGRPGKSNQAAELAPMTQIRARMPLPLATGCSDQRTSELAIAVLAAERACWRCCAVERVQSGLVGGGRSTSARWPGSATRRWHALYY